MDVVIAVWVLGLVALFAGAVSVTKFCLQALSDGWLSAGIFLSLVGVFFLGVTTFIGVPVEMPSGLPKTSINTGEYKVAFVYVAGENVNLGIEEVSNEKERLYLYQFPKSAFDSGSMNIQANKLVVVESGNFRKLVLK